MTMPMQWIGPDESLAVGDVGFLIEFVRGAVSNWVLRDTPAHTSTFHNPQLNGWCGTYDDTATHAHGMAKVVKVARSGRAQVQHLEGEELIAALEELGYPGLD